MKVCYKCKKKKPLTEFHKFKSGVNKGYYRSYCKVCNRKQSTEYRKTHPWVRAYAGIYSRCKLKSSDSYKRYRHIKNLLCVEDLRFLWLRDQAYFMKHPSIDRINPTGNYERSNCRYIELSENSRQGGLKTKKDFKEVNLGNKSCD